MRILFLSNYYPPYSRGGYEQWCQEVAIELVRRGHQVAVLTSRTPDYLEIDDQGVQVYRMLNLEVDGGLSETVIRLLKNRKRLEQENLEYVQAIHKDFNPDMAMMWGMWNVPRSVPALVEKLLPSNHVFYYVCDYWLSLPNAYIQRWQISSRQTLTQLPKWLLGQYFLPRLSQETPIPLRLERPICVSQRVRALLVEAGVSIPHAQVIYGGTQIEDFLEARQNSHNSKNGQGSLKLVYIGRIVADKGLHTIIDALTQIQQAGKANLTLDIFGKGDPDYEAEIKQAIDDNQLDQIVTFCGSVDRAAIPALLVQYDALIFSSEWEEPFARTVLEAMVAGLAVIGTTTGGTGEILEEEKTGLTYPAGNAHKLAEQLCRLMDDDQLTAMLAAAGQQCVIENFSFSGMVDQLEAVFEEVVEQEFV